MNPIHKSFLIPHIWINIFSLCSYCEVFNIFKFLYLYQKNIKENLNIDELHKSYILNKINSDTISNIVYTVFIKLKHSYIRPSINYHIKYYTLLYTKSLKLNSTEFYYSYIVKIHLDKILNNNQIFLNKKTTKHKLFNSITEYLNKRYEIQFNKEKQSICFKNKCQQKKCDNCLQMNHWNKLLTILHH